jgi:hypothetical protein
MRLARNHNTRQRDARPPFKTTYELDLERWEHRRRVRRACLLVALVAWIALACWMCAQGMFGDVIDSLPRG